MDVPHYLPHNLSVWMSALTSKRSHLTTWLHVISKHYQCKLCCLSDYPLHSHSHTCTALPCVGFKSGQSSPANCRPGGCGGGSAQGIISGSLGQSMAFTRVKKQLALPGCYSGIFSDSALVPPRGEISVGARGSCEIRVRGYSRAQLLSPVGLHQLCTCKKVRGVRTSLELGHCRQAVGMLCGLLAHTC